MSEPQFTHALSIRQPYCELILRGIKTVECRTKPTTLKNARVYLYAPAGKEPAHAVEQAKKDHDIDTDTLPTGVLVGSVVILGCTGGAGRYEWHLADPLRLPVPLQVSNQPQPGIWKPQLRLP